MAIYYIDNINGKSSNSGLSPNEPLDTNKNININPGDTVLFKRGSFIRGTLNNVDGAEGKPTYYGAYGEGKNPVFCGSKSASSPENWEETEKNIWKCKVKLETELCNIVFSDFTCGTLKWEKRELSEQGDYWSNSYGFGNRNMSCEHQEFYMYSKKNPAEFYGHIECVHRNARQLAKNGHDMVISDLTFINNGVHGIAGECASRNLHIKNCRFERIGGCVWDKDLKIRFGNGVECWDVCENVIVENCIFNDIYDSAVTHQGGGSSTTPADNFIIKNNVFIKCGMAAYEQRDVLPKHAEFNNNICLDAGLGFSKNGVVMPRKSEIWPQPMGHHIFIWRIEKQTLNAHFEIKNNFFGSAPYGGAIYSIISTDAEEQIDLDMNVYKMSEKTLLNRFFGTDFMSFEDYVKFCKKDINAVKISKT